MTNQIELRYKEEKKHSVVYANKDFPGVYIPRKYLANPVRDTVWLTISDDRAQDVLNTSGPRTVDPFPGKPAPKWDGKVALAKDEVEAIMRQSLERKLGD